VGGSHGKVGDGAIADAGRKEIWSREEPHQSPLLDPAHAGEKGRKRYCSVPMCEKIGPYVPGALEEVGVQLEFKCAKESTQREPG
jgi:hypothetical protein